MPAFSGLSGLSVCQPGSNAWECGAPCLASAGAATDGGDGPGSFGLGVDAGNSHRPLALLSGSPKGVVW